MHYLNVLPGPEISIFLFYVIRHKLFICSLNFGTLSIVIPSNSTVSLSLITSELIFNFTLLQCFLPRISTLGQSVAGRGDQHTWLGDTRVIVDASSSPPISLKHNQINKRTNVNQQHIINQSNSNSTRWLNLIEQQSGKYKCCD